MGENTCPRIGWLFGGCKFRPRYDTVGQVDSIAWMMSLDSKGPPAARSTYICDVCERCGKTLFRRKDAVKP